jgi:hypothetical protein
MECERAQLPRKEVDGEEFAASMVRNSSLERMSLVCGDSAM